MSEEVQEEKKSGGKGLIIVLLVVVILLLVGIGVMAFLLLSGDKSGGNGSADSGLHGSAEHGSENGHADENSHAKEYSPKYKQFEPPAPESPPIYFTMEKFVVNFNGNGQAKFLAVDLKFMSYYPQVVGDAGEMEPLRPILKNDIERLLRNQSYNELSKVDGLDKFFADILDVTRKVLENHNIYPGLLEDVFMTRFVMQ